MSTSFFRSPAFKAFAKRTYASQPTPGASAQATVDSAVSKASKTAESTLEQAQKTALEYGQKAQKMAGPTGQKVFNRVSAVSDYIIYNAKLVAALGKQVYIAEKLAPPTSLGEVVGGWATLWSRAKNVNYWAGLGKSGEWKTVAVYSVQAYGLFHVGEMIGRRKVVGYAVEDNFPVHPAPEGAAHH